ncbi:kinase-like domain-containing protein [Trametes elegans]|nr:kinase-like domain-containing protein [Trametes elegans]
MLAQDTQHQLPKHAVLDDERVKRAARRTNNGVYNLSPGEQFWTDRQQYLQQRGYQLRPRYIPGWEPSWKGTNLNPTFCEDSIMLITSQVIDARRTEDEKLVAFKKFNSHSQESCIASFLASIKDPQNRCVPVHEILPDPFDPQLSLMVMPYLRPCNNPDFSTVGDVIEFINQTLEGLAFLHRHRIAHRDVAIENIMMDAECLYPDGHHPVRLEHTPDALYEVKPLLRGERFIRYYYIDFGLSLRFPEGTTPSAIGRVGRDKEAPELSSTVTYDPFKLDIFVLANMYSKEFEQKYNSTQFLLPLIDPMRKTSPSLRPTAAQALEKWHEIRAELHESLYRWRLGPKTEPAFERMVNDTVAVAWEGIHRIKKFVL